MNIKDIIQTLKKGGIGVLPTDTIYGIVGSALNSQTIERIYKLRKRDTDKPMIILISSINELELFKTRLSSTNFNFLKKIWPNPISVILPCSESEFSYLHRNKKTLAFRVPNNKFLLEILKATGPLVAPSANFEGEKASINTEEAREYFKDGVDFYFDGGDLESEPSTLIELIDGKVNILRQGEYKI